MRWTIVLPEIDENQRHAVGGKGFALARMAKNGLRVPPALCITTEAYDEYLAGAGLRERIMTELHRKDFREMRWEEVWDTALRIRNLFLTHPLRHVDPRRHHCPRVRSPFCNRRSRGHGVDPDRRSSHRGWFSWHRHHRNRPLDDHDCYPSSQDKETRGQGLSSLYCRRSSVNPGPAFPAQ